MPFTYSDLTDAAGKIRLNVVMTLAASKARQEVKGCAQIGWVRSYRTVFAQELVYIWCSAKSARDSIIAARLRAALSANEQGARTLDLAATLAATAIPPRPTKALALHRQAAELRELDRLVGVVGLAMAAE